MGLVGWRKSGKKFLRLGNGDNFGAAPLFQNKKVIIAGDKVIGFGILSSDKYWVVFRVAKQ